jgi:hypothetical protein
MPTGLPMLARQCVGSVATTSSLLHLWQQVNVGIDANHNRQRHATIADGDEADVGVPAIPLQADVVHCTLCPNLGDGLAPHAAVWAVGQCT